jgi:hypothetical protein
VKLGPFQITRDVAVAAAAPVKSARKEIGASGTVILQGFLTSSEYNADLRGRAGLVKFNRMLSSDASVQEALEHLNAPLKNATWTVEPPDDPDDDELIATAIAQAALFDWLDHPWVEHVDQALDYLALGHAVFEPTWQVVERELRVPIPGEFDVHSDGSRTEKVKVIPQQQYLTLKRFAPRLQDTIYKWNVDGGDLVSIEQQVFKDDKWQEIEIQAEDLMVLTHKKRGDDFTGRAVLRSAYKAWTLKELAEKTSAVAIERHGVGVPVGYLPQSQANDDAALARLESILQDLRAGAFSYIAASGPKATATTDGYFFEFMPMTGTIPDFSDILNYHRGEIKAAVLARFAELGHANVGARSTGDTQSVVWFAALGAIGAYLCEKHTPILKKVIDQNIKVTRYPKLTISDVEVRNLTEFAEATAKLVASGAVHADDSFRSYVRKGIDAPEEDQVDDEGDQTPPGPPTDTTTPNPDPSKPDLGPDPAAKTDSKGRPIESTN